MTCICAAARARFRLTFPTAELESFRRRRTHAVRRESRPARWLRPACANRRSLARRAVRSSVHCRGSRALREIGGAVGALTERRGQLGFHFPRGHVSEACQAPQSRVGRTARSRPDCSPDCRAARTRACRPRGLRAPAKPQRLARLEIHFVKNLRDHPTRRANAPASHPTQAPAAHAPPTPRHTPEITSASHSSPADNQSEQLLPIVAREAQIERVPHRRSARRPRASVRYCCGSDPARVSGKLAPAHCPWPIRPRFGCRTTRICVRPTSAITPISMGRISQPERNTNCPRAIDAAQPHDVLASRHLGLDTCTNPKPEPATNFVCSIITTASAPLGIGAPVMMRVALPRVTIRVGSAPAVTSSRISKLRGTFREIGRNHGIAIDQRFIVRRRVDVARNIFSQDSTKRLLE